MCCVLGCSGRHNFRRLHDTFAGDGQAPVGGGVYCVEDEGRSEKLGSFLGVVGGAVVLREIVAAVGGSRMSLERWSLLDTPRYLYWEYGIPTYTQPL